MHSISWFGAATLRYLKKWAEGIRVTMEGEWGGDTEIKGECIIPFGGRQPPSRRMNEGDCSEQQDY